MNALSDLSPTAGAGLFAADHGPDDVLVLLIVCLSAVAVIGLVLCFLSRICSCLVECCDCLGRCLQPQRQARVSLFVHQKRRGVRDTDRDFVEPFLGPPEYDQPHGELSPPPYHHIPTAPPLSP
ncbi:hypothetical protein ACHHYP_09709 [Achlya hypogyna]|uniref:Uncharacterized protein n=1 Tax=Achlya hypogyna TaxID=1202772 RepID=A0A1V9YMK1_ACHHY|nr:hypothetical protein ACHHYP_09709 [Achlya hypogyna]